ncbi:MAG: DUF6265 family protein [Flavobacteriales bacterium]
MTRLLILMSFYVLMASTGCDDDAHFDFNQLNGHWQCVNSESGQRESWVAAGENEFIGKGYVLDGSDTIFVEKLSILQSKEVWVFTTKTGDMTEPIPFTLNYQSGNKVEFINPSMDFPKKIGYEVFTADSIQSYCEGPRDGQNVRILFDLVRIQN